ncbi:MAG TPA: hypothetical protein VNN80_01300 [Polyangiaceae bacterium]|nr:hypothetical protein [Polyangiaceae bacterium]
MTLTRDCLGFAAPRVFGFTALVLALTACAGPGLPSPSKPRESAAPQPSAAPAPRTSLPEAAAPLPPEPLPDGCATAVPSGLAPVERLDALAAACARGMRPLSPSARVTTLAAGGTLAFPFSLADASRCLRAGATCSAGVRELELAVIDSADRVLGADRLTGGVALANREGPICVPSAGEYRAVIRAVQGSGEVALQVWQAE